MGSWVSAAKAISVARLSVSIAKNRFSAFSQHFVSQDFSAPDYVLCIRLRKPDP
jgi:hypothetical protein